MEWMSDKSIIALLALAAMIPMAAGKIDLTVGYGIVLWHILAISLQTSFGIPWPMAVLIVLLLGALTGFLDVTAYVGEKLVPLWTRFSDGTVWFSDPTYGIDSHYEGHRAAPELASCDVYRLDLVTGEVRAVVTDMLRPNGLCFSPNEDFLYVSETGRTHDPACEPAIRAYPLDAAGRVGGGRLFARSPNGFFDGFRADTAGNVWASNADAVCVYAPDGTHIGSIPVPEMISNLCFGGPKRNRLFITAQTSLYAIYVNAHGAGWAD